jgi:hypothetical protein
MVVLGSKIRTALFFVFDFIIFPFIILFKGPLCDIWGQCYQEFAPSLVIPYSGV